MRGASGYKPLASGCRAGSNHAYKLHCTMQSPCHTQHRLPVGDNHVARHRRGHDAAAGCRGAAADIKMRSSAQSPFPAASRHAEHACLPGPDPRRSC
ncbi:hypothetical protein VFPFJ_00721 [Purpureocillium lilacinum]|uniref:Uncharacterized protein n=1 Tax=Purpureocillium lilacinum TaxID=33203 RepID=A0A179HXJ7_PURLI|nr:hypothetical protein VFPFJ_00721 [Purpureocillium lilacinum]OAQ94612.1 hypothetical protein VFPFJ_00721 [Purpureocillium lilacinum]